MLLIPQRPGQLLLPTVDIQPVPSYAKGVDQNGAVPAAENSISSEVEYVNQAETVMVIPNVSSMTVRTDVDSSSGG